MCQQLTLVCLFSINSTDYVEDIYQSFLTTQQDGRLLTGIVELKEMTPEPINTMLEKQPKDEAIKKRQQRRAMKAIDVTLTASGFV